jgi:hypothetical protein
MSIRWIRNVIIEGQKTSLEVQMGDRIIGDKTYTRVGKELENWFENRSNDKNQIVEQGKGILKERLAGKKITTLEGKLYDWS